MAEVKWKVAGYQCRNELEYKAALRDLDKIAEIRRKVDFKHFDEVSALYSDLQTGQIKFETKIGRDFDDEIYGLYFERSSTNDTVSNKKSKGNKEAKDKKNNTLKKKKIEKIDLSDFDEEMQKQIVKELKAAERKRKLVITICISVAALCMIYFGIYYFMTLKNEKIAGQLSDHFEQSTTIFSFPTQSNTSETVTQGPNKPPSVIDKYADLYAQNKSLIGWIKIADINTNETVLSYPVMQTVDNEYYLTHNFNQEYDKNGCIFLDKDCSIYPRSTNLILYGHHMKSGMMFGKLNLYQDESYYQAHPVILFDTIYEEGMYQVMYVFRDKVYEEEDVNFKYYQFVDANSKEEFDSYMNEMSQASFYDTKVTANENDLLLTLSTCDYAQTDGRFVVVAKRIYSEEEIVK